MDKTLELLKEFVKRGPRESFDRDALCFYCGRSRLGEDETHSLSHYHNCLWQRANEHLASLEVAL